jgi:hypothetical protein
MFDGSVFGEIWLVNQALEVFRVQLCLLDKVAHVNLGLILVHFLEYLKPMGLAWLLLKNAFEEILRVFDRIKTATFNFFQFFQ